MPATPRPPSDTPPDPAIERLADLDDMLTGAGSRPDPSAPFGESGQEPADESRVRPEQLDFLLRLNQIGASWREWTSQEDSATARTRIDRFEIVREVGQGGFATVYEATDTLLGRRVALKVAHPDSLLSARLRKRFLQAAELASRLSHPNLATIYDLGESDGVVFIAEEFCSGGSLAAWLDRHQGPVDPGLAALVVKHLAEALDVAHEAGIIHRDIKPENVLLAPATSGVLPAVGNGTPSGPGFDVKLGDFGLGKLDQDRSSPLTQVTRAGAILGTPAWMAPEQVDPAIGEVGPATDVHALGLLLDRLLTGRCRWAGKTDSETLRMILLHDPETVDRAQAGVPRDLLAVCRKCLTRNPGERYRRGGELAAELSRFLLGVPTLTRPLSPWERACRIAARRPAAFGAAAITLLALCVAGIALWGWSSQSSAATRQRETMRRIDAAMHLQRGLDDLRAGNVAAASERFAAGASLDPSLDASFAGRWGRRRLRCEADILYGDADAPVSTEGPPRDLHCVAVSPAGGTIAAGAVDGRLILLAADGAGTPVVVSEAHDEINDVAFSPDGRLVATAGQDGRVRLWDTATGAPARDLAAESKPLFAVGWSPDGTRLAWGGEERILSVGPCDGGLPSRFPLPSTAGPGSDTTDVEAILFVDDRSIVVAFGPRIVLLNAGDGGVIREFDRHFGVVGNLDLSPDRTRLLSAGTDRVPRVWDIATGVLLAELPLHPDWVQGCVYVSDGTRIVTGCRDGVLQVFDAVTGTCLCRLPGHVGRTWEVRGEPKGTVLSVGADGTLRRFVPRQASALAGARESVVERGAIRKVLALPEETQTTVSGGDAVLSALFVPMGGPLLVVDGRDGQTRRTVPVPADTANPHVYAAIDRRNDRVALLDSLGSLSLLPLNSPVESPTSTRRGWCRVGWSADGRCVAATTGRSCTIVGIDEAAGGEAMLDRLDVICDAFALSPDGGAVAAGGSSVLHVTPIARVGAPRATGPTRALSLDPSFGKLVVLAWSPDGRCLAVGSSLGSVRILDATNGATLRILPGHRGSIVSLVWSADGGVVISADDEMIRLSDADTSVAIDFFTPGWAIRSMTLTGLPDHPDRWLMVGGESSVGLPSGNGIPEPGRLLVVDLGS